MGNSNPRGGSKSDPGERRSGQAQARNPAFFTSLWTYYVGNSVGNEFLSKKKGPAFLANPLISLWWAMGDSNARPLVPETNALST
jgi:hypothetical protein